MVIARNAREGAFARGRGRNTNQPVDPDGPVDRMLDFALFQLSFGFSLSYIHRAQIGPFFVRIWRLSKTRRKGGQFVWRLEQKGPMTGPRCVRGRFHLPLRSGLGQIRPSNGGQLVDNRDNWPVLGYKSSSTGPLPDVWCHPSRTTSLYGYCRARSVLSTLSSALQ